MPKLEEQKPDKSFPDSASPAAADPMPKLEEQKHYKPQIHYQKWGSVAQWVSAAGILFGIFGGVVAYRQYAYQRHEARLQRALALIEKFNTEPVPPQYRELAKTDGEEEEARWKAIEDRTRRALVVHFHDRFEIPPKPLPDSDAKLLVEVALKTKLDLDDRKLFERWEAARRHLNNLEPLAFAYVYDFADQELLAAAACGTMVRSNAYFQKLIHELRDKSGAAQSWQIIPKAVKMMESNFGGGCEGIYGK